MDTPATARETPSCGHEEEIEGLKREIAALRAELNATHAILTEKDAHLQRILNSLGWRLLSRYGRFKYGVLIPARDWLRRKTRPAEPDAPATLAPVADEMAAPAERREVTYAEWAVACEAVRYDPDRAARRVAALARRPLVSVVTPVYNTPADVLDAAIHSVRGQLYPEWELCLFDDCSTKEHVRPALERHAAGDARIRLGFGEENGGISAALNGALALATGEYVAFLDHDDELTPDALLEMVSAIEETGADILYSDEDKRDARGRRHDAFFKPDWSPDFFLSIMYTCHLTVMRRDLVERIGGFRKGFEGSQDYDLWLRAVEQTDRIVHVPMILYHWRQIPGSTAVDVSNKGYAHERSKRAIGEALTRRGIAGTVGDGPVPTSFRVVRHVVDDPLVSIIIPTRDRVDLLSTAIRGIEEKTDYRNVEVIVVDNGSTDPATLEYLDRSPHRVLRDDGAFNFSRLNNRAVAEAHGQFVLLLNNDTEPIDPGWLRAMVEHAQRPEVGLVGAKLLYPSGKVQHGGVVLGIGGVAGHSHKYFTRDASGYFQALNLIRNFSAVTAACVLMRKEVFDEVGGLDEVNLAVAFNDVDFCLRVRERGYLCVWTPYALVAHFESESRGFELNAKEIDYMIVRWGEQLFRDPYYNPNLTLVHEDFSFDLTRPDGYRAMTVRRASDDPALRLERVSRLVSSFRSTHDRLGGVAFEVASIGRPVRGLSVRLDLFAINAVGDTDGTLVATAWAKLATTTPGRDLFVLFDTPIVQSQAAFRFELTLPEARDGAVEFRAANGVEPAFRLLFR